MSTGVAQATTLPRALEHLTGLARRLAAPTGLPDGLRTWVTAPTSRLAIAASVLGALEAQVTCNGCFHNDIHVGNRVAAYYDRRFDDRTLVAVSDTDVHYGTQIPRSTAPAPRLPDDLGKRNARRLTDDRRDHLADAYQCDPSLAGHRHVRASIHPVVVVGLPERTEHDLRAWWHLPGADQRAVQRAKAGDVDDWYRETVIAAGPMPSLARRPWLTQVKPRLVITTTTAAALAATPWPDVPVLSLLSRRSPSTVAAAELIQQMRTTPAVASARLATALMPGHGLEIHAAHLPVDQPMPVAGDDTDDEELEW